MIEVEQLIGRPPIHPELIGSIQEVANNVLSHATLERLTVEFQAVCAEYGWVPIFDPVKQAFGVIYPDSNNGSTRYLTDGGDGGQHEVPLEHAVRHWYVAKEAFTSMRFIPPGRT